MFSMTDSEWRRQNKTVTSRLKVILRQQIFTDAVFLVQGKEFKCHRLILAVGSAYFERMFYHTFRNTGSQTITISDVTPEAFQNVLNFLYTDKVTFGNETQAFETYEAADKFQMSDLKSECEIYLAELDFRPRTVWGNLERARALSMDKMRKRYLAYIESHAHDCLQEDSFLSAKDDVVMTILQCDSLAVAEIELLYKLAAWGRNRAAGSSKYFLKPYLGHVRFRALTPKEFCAFTKAYPNLIDSADSLAIIQHLELPMKNSLPTWCCRFPRRKWP